MYSRILVPVDGSEAATAGLEEAIKLAQSPDARLRLVHVVNEMILASPFVVGTFDPVQYSLQTSSRSCGRTAEHTLARLNR